MWMLVKWIGVAGADGVDQVRLDFARSQIVYRNVDQNGLPYRPHIWLLSALVKHGP